MKKIITILGVRVNPWALVWLAMSVAIIVGVDKWLIS